MNDQPRQLGEFSLDDRKLWVFALNKEKRALRSAIDRIRKINSGCNTMATNGK